MILFGVLYLYSSYLAPMTGTQIFVWRILVMFLVLFLYLICTQQIQIIIQDLRTIHQQKKWLYFLLPTPIMLSQLWLFMWSPLNGHGVAVAMGYFLFPLAMVLIGFFAFKEQLVGLQKLAVFFAVLGVAMEVIQGGSLTWATFWVCATYPIYYIMRRQLVVRAITGLFVDTAVFLPIGVLYLLYYFDLTYPILSSFMVVKVLGLGILSVLAFMANLQAVRMLPVSLFGMLSYLEPILLFVFSIVILNETIYPNTLINYTLVAVGVVFLIVHGTLKNKTKNI